MSERTTEQLSNDVEKEGRMFCSPFALGTIIYDQYGEAYIIDEVRFTSYGKYVSATSSDGTVQTFNVGDEFINKTVFLTPPPKNIGGYYENS